MKLETPPKHRGAAPVSTPQSEWEDKTAPTQRGRLRWVAFSIVLFAAVAWLSGSQVAVDDNADTAFTIVKATEDVPLPAAGGVTNNTSEQGSGGNRGNRPDEVPLVPVGWAQMPDAPMEPVVDSPIAVLGDTFVTVGALDDELLLAKVDLHGFPGAGGIEERAASLWQVYPPAPLAARAGPYLTAIDDVRIIVWGGTAGVNGTGSALHDGALFNSTTGEWHRLPLFPTSIERVRTAGWVAGRLIVVGVQQRSAPVAYSWSPDETEWQRLPPPPVADMVSVASVVGADTLLTYGISEGDGVMRTQLFLVGYRPEQNEWRSYSVVPLQQMDRIAAVAMNRDEVFMWGRPSTNDANPRPDGLTLQTDSGLWRQLPTAGSKVGGGGTTVASDPSHLSAAWTGAGVVVSGDPETYMLHYATDTRAWAALARPPVTVGGRLAFADGRLVRWGGRKDGVEVPSLWVFSEP